MFRFKSVYTSTIIDETGTNIRANLNAISVKCLRYWITLAHAKFTTGELIRIDVNDCKGNKC